MRKRPLFLWACVFLTGLAFVRYKTPELIVILFVVLGTEFYYGLKTKAYKRMAGRSVALLSAFILGAFHMYQEQSFREAYLSKINDGDSAIIWGEISKIENVDYGIRILLSDCYIHLEGEAVPCNDVLVYTSSTDYQVGEIHKISGQINRFQHARNQGNFDSEQFYQSQKIDFSIRISESSLLGKKENRFRDGVLELKEELKQVYSSCLEYRTAGFYTGMILGDKSGLGQDLKSLFTDGGIVHILAVSGLHVSIVGRGLYQFLRKCGIRFLGAGLVGSVCLLFYCYMTGSGMSAERAVGMMLLFFLGQVLGKSYDMLNALGGVGILLLSENPFLLEYSGFWFSVMALIGIGFVSELFSWRLKLSAGLWASLGITLATLPITAFCYYEIPLYSPIINAILLPLLTPAFGLALVGGFVGIFLPEVAAVILLPCH